MRNKMNKTGKVTTNPSSFGGLISPNDFETDFYPDQGRHIADRIASNWRFDEHCKKNELIRNKRKDYERNEDK